MSSILTIWFFHAKLLGTGEHREETIIGATRAAYLRRGFGGSWTPPTRLRSRICRLIEAAPASPIVVSALTNPDLGGVGPVELCGVHHGLNAVGGRRRGRQLQYFRVYIAGVVCMCVYAHAVDAGVSTSGSISLVGMGGFVDGIVFSIRCA